MKSIMILENREGAPGVYGTLGVSQNICSGNECDELQESTSDETIADTIMSNNAENECTLLLPSGENNVEYDDGDEDRYSEQAQMQKHMEYRHENRFIILAVVAITPFGVKFFKAAQSSFEEYLMHDPAILMNATTYSLMLSLMSLPVATLVGGAMLDYKADKQREHDNKKQRKNRISNCLWNLMASSRHSCLRTSRTPSYSAICFLAISLLGIVVYGYGLEVESSIPMGLVGATIFGLGEGCVVVASRTFVAHAFYGSDGAFAQGVLVAMNNFAMMASKISLPWLIENEKKTRPFTNNCIQNVINLECFDDDDFVFEYYHNRTKTHRRESVLGGPGANENNIWIGILACCFVQLVSLVAGILYAWWFGSAPLPRNLQIQTSQKPSQSSGQSSSEQSASSRIKRNILPGSSLHSSVTACFENLPITFWIVAIGRAIFVVVFKVFTRNSNSFLMEKFGVSAVAAGRKSSFHELFALASPLVGFIAYRSPGGIVPVLLFAAALASVSIAALACIPADTIQSYFPGGAVLPLIGISISHGIFIPICMAIIPQTCSPEHLGMAFAVVEVLGSLLNLTNILFGWLRDATGNYEVPMEMLLIYSMIGMLLLWISRNHIKLKQPGE
mmetsp:Transcript_11313/g.32596  ORF Transcript_11313/g.32596 Transcript_11313/m.32596 type:complete len:619 (-) Transcript_11313:251-2107(-)